MELEWVHALQRAKRGLLGCIYYDSGKNEVLTHRDEERRVVVRFLEDLQGRLPAVKGDIKYVWSLAHKSIVPQKWVKKGEKDKTVVTIRNSYELERWFKDIIALHQNDHVSLEKVMDERDAPPPELPVKHGHTQAEKQDAAIMGMFSHTAAAPTLEGQMRMWASFIDLVDQYDDTTLDYLNELDPDSIPLDVWVSALRLANEGRISEGVKILKALNRESELRD